MDEIRDYKKFLMNRVTITPPLIAFLENCLASEDEAMKHSFHKIMIHNWMDSAASTQLFEALTDYFGVTFIPIHCETQNSLTTFYTCSLHFILKIIKLDFMFPHSRSMVNIDILFNDKNSAYLFKKKTTIDDIVSRVVSLRFKENLELNLSNFINDEEFTQINIHFYKLSLLAHFKLLMLRMGRDTRILNLSNNNLSQVPLEILNFFIKGDLIEVNLSNNNIPSISELHRISSKIEKLWVEGNPLCENMAPMAYIKQLSLKFPRLTELDGVRLNEHGLMIPFYNNFLVVADKKTKMIIEKFVSLYFAHYDTLRSKLEEFYDEVAYLSISHTFTGVVFFFQFTLDPASITIRVDRENINEADESIKSLQNYILHSRNILNPKHKEWNLNFRRIYKKKTAIMSVLSQLPRTTHDPSTFTVDVLRHDNKVLTVVFEGVFKEHLKDGSERFMHFRRTFMFDIYSVNTMSFYKIVHEMFTVSFATPEMIKSSFEHPVRHLNQLTLINPDKEERDVLCTAFIHYTQLKKSEAEARLLYHDWDLRLALKAFAQDFKNNRISDDKMLVDEDISDISSLLDDDVD